jgi:hypothetical protein
MMDAPGASLPGSASRTDAKAFTPHEIGPAIACDSALAERYMPVFGALVELDVINVLHAKKTQDPALQPAQIGREGQGRPRSGAEGMPLHVVE